MTTYRVNDGVTLQGRTRGAQYKVDRYGAKRIVCEVGDDYILVTKGRGPGNTDHVWTSCDPDYEIVGHSPFMEV